MAFIFYITTHGEHAVYSTGLCALMDFQRSTCLLVNGKHFIWIHLLLQPWCTAKMSNFRTHLQITSIIPRCRHGWLIFLWVQILLDISNRLCCHWTTFPENLVAIYRLVKKIWECKVVHSYCFSLGGRELAGTTSAHKIVRISGQFWAGGHHVGRLVWLFGIHILHPTWYIH